jgi:nitrite reductase/ring-hydroxylating ferredoxin subunit
MIVEAGGRSIGIFRVGGRFLGILNRCPHGGAPLCLGSVAGMSVASQPGPDVEWTRDGEILRCPWHGWEFDILTGESVTAPAIRVKRFDVSVRDGRLYVAL